MKPVNGVRTGGAARLPVKEKFDVNDRLAALNRALTQLQEEEGGEYSVESIERPRVKKNSGIKRRLSYVEHSYNKLTNSTYTTNDSLQGTRNTVHLDNWGQ